MIPQCYRCGAGDLVEGGHACLSTDETCAYGGDTDFLVQLISPSLADQTGGESFNGLKSYQLSSSTYSDRADYSIVLRISLEPSPTTSLK